ncbi:MAG: DUF3822 family protein [Ferruginibacter sp.]
MNNLIKILPSAEDASTLHLLAETDDAGIAFVFYTSDPFEMKGLHWYQFAKGTSSLDNINEMEKLLSSEEILQQPFLSVALCSNVKEAILVPEKYFNVQNAEAMISLQYGNGYDGKILSEETPVINAVVAYKPATTFIKIWNQKFPGSTTHHSTALQLKDKSFDANVLDCIISPLFIKLFLYKNGMLQIVQQFDYKVPADVVYHMLNSCMQFELEPAKVFILLSGLIEENSALYQEIYKYFLQVKFMESPTDLCSEAFQEYPSHYFSSLIHLARQCAL